MQIKAAICADPQPPQEAGDPESAGGDDMKRGSWEAPKLIVLGRANPEEAVLVHCKVNNPTAVPTGPGIYVAGCFDRTCNKACQANAFSST